MNWLQRPVWGNCVTTAQRKNKSSRKEIPKAKTPKTCIAARRPTYKFVNRKYKFFLHVTDTHIKFFNLKLKKISALGLSRFRPALQLWLVEQIPQRTQPRFPGGKPLSTNRQVGL